MYNFWKTEWPILCLSLLHNLSYNSPKLTFSNNISRDWVCRKGEAQVSIYWSLYVATALTSTLFLSSYVYIPILPSALLDFISAPTPFIMGVHTNYKNNIPEGVSSYDKHENPYTV
jgi:hypothetical protein